MALFQQSVLKKHIETLNKEVIAQKWEKFQAHFLNATIQQNIRKSKEEQYQEGFLRDLFVNIFGYILNPTEHYNLTTELKNITNSKKVDGAIVIDGKAIGVIELKGTDTTDLAKIEAQAFGYKTNQPGCNYVITSNFEKLRFYIDNTTQYQEFNLFTLTKDEFTVLYCCLDWESISNNLPTNLLNQSVSKENAITKQLYNDYSAFKRGLYNNLVELNPQHDKLLLFKKTQKLLDRFLFIFFAEDRLLLPTNLIRRINKEWENLQKMRIPVSLYDRYVMYFHDLNEGAKVTLPAFGKKTGEAIEETHEIFAYNGGLFKNDEFLDNLKINDQLLYEHTHKLSDYDFQSEVDVNILGHIFENSLNEIDEIKSEIEGNVVDKTKTKRKKDGVFYTPKYITKYIVDNTVGKLCTEKKEELQLIEEEYHTEKNLQTKTKKALLDKLTTYREWLLQLTICDPACGSGAFLNQALEFLIEEHTYIDELQAKLMGDSLVLSDVENSILENNLYGVDLNDESIEIAKLSLWLRTAQKGRKLNSLNNNIKCGNSLIDDPEVAGEKAFSWEKEFPEVFAKGGFDVVIGNPPYVRVQNIDENNVSFFEKEYQTAKGKFDLYVLFNELSCEKLISEKGIICFIQPHRFISADFGKGLRNYFNLNRYLSKIISFSDIDIFESANTYTGIFFIQKNNNDFLQYFEFQNVTNKLIEEKLPRIDVFQKINYIKLKDNWTLKSSDISNILDKIKKNKSLNFYTKNISQGVIPGNDKIYYFEIIEENNDYYKIKNLNNEIFEIEKGLVRKIIKGNNVSRYLLPENDYYIIYPYQLFNSKQTILDEKEFSSKFPKTYQYLSNYKDFLIELRIKYKTNIEWYGFHRPREMRFLESKKIITTHASIKPNFTYSENEYFNQNVYGIEVNDNQNVKYFLCILNSNITNFIIKNISSMINGGYYLYKSDYLNQIPIILSKNQLPFIEKADLMLSLNKDFQLNVSKFSNYYSKQYQIEKLTGKLEKWYELEFIDFIKELNKAIKTAKGTPLSKKDEFEWMDLFEDNKKKALELKAEIDQTDKEIDQMVYELYGLTEEEIKIVEGV